MPDKPHVYIVDDDEAVRDSLSVLIEGDGFAVRSFASAPSFLAAAADLPPGVLIADIRMPEMDGLELQQRLAERALAFPMIITPGQAGAPRAVRGRRGGARDFTETPFAPQPTLDS